jgi:hypothetical protein
VGLDAWGYISLAVGDKKITAQMIAAVADMMTAVEKTNVAALNGDRANICADDW